MDIVFPLSTAPGMTPNEGGGRLVNAYVEELPQREPRPAWRRVPGLERLLDIEGRAHCRGLFAVDGTVFLVLDERIYAVTASEAGFAATDLGALAGTEPVTFARNRAEPANVVCVTENGAFNLFAGSAPTSLADGDLPVPSAVAFLNGYFVFTTGDGRLICSDLNAVSVNALSFTRAQQRADGLTRAVAFRENLFAFGPASCEVYRDVGTAPFPLGFVTMMPRGLIAPHAVAGFEDGWANELIWVADDAIVYRLNGYEPARISPPWLSRRIEGLEAAGRAALRAFVTMAGGHAFWHLTAPGWTVVYDHTTGQWHEREAHGGGPWRAASSVRFAERWLVGDRERGALYAVSETASRDHDTPIEMRLDSAPARSFPTRLAVPRADFDFTPGVGVAAGDAPTQSTPRVAISWSDDGGASFSNPVWREIGGEGAFQRRVTVLRTGVAGPYGRVWRVALSDPVHACFRGGTMALEGRAE
jgi:hypothetical protein